MFSRVSAGSARRFHWIIGRYAELGCFFRRHLSGQLVAHVGAVQALTRNVSNISCRIPSTPAPSPMMGPFVNGKHTRRRLASSSTPSSFPRHQLRSSRVDSYTNPPLRIRLRPIGSYLRSAYRNFSHKNGLFLLLSFFLFLFIRSLHVLLLQLCDGIAEVGAGARVYLLATYFPFVLGFDSCVITCHIVSAIARDV